MFAQNSTKNFVYEADDEQYFYAVNSKYKGASKQQKKILAQKQAKLELEIKNAIHKYKINVLQNMTINQSGDVTKVEKMQNIEVEHQRFTSQVRHFIRCSQHQICQDSKFYQMQTDSSFKLEKYGQTERDMAQDECLQNQYAKFDPSIYNQEYNTTLFTPNINLNIINQNSKRIENDQREAHKFAKSQMDSYNKIQEINKSNGSQKLVGNNYQKQQMAINNDFIIKTPSEYSYTQREIKKKHDILKSENLQNIQNEQPIRSMRSPRKQMKSPRFSQQSPLKYSYYNSDFKRKIISPFKKNKCLTQSIDLRQSSEQQISLLAQSIKFNNQNLYLPSISDRNKTFLAITINKGLNFTQLCKKYSSIVKNQICQIQLIISHAGRRFKTDQEFLQSQIPFYKTFIMGFQETHSINKNGYLALHKDTLQILNQPLIVEGFLVFNNKDPFDISFDSEFLSQKYIFLGQKVIDWRDLLHVKCERNVLLLKQELAIESNSLQTHSPKRLNNQFVENECKLEIELQLVPSIMTPEKFLLEKKKEIPKQFQNVSVQNISMSEVGENDLNTSISTEQYLLNKLQNLMNEFIKKKYTLNKEFGEYLEDVVSINHIDQEKTKLMLEKEQEALQYGIRNGEIALDPRCYNLQCDWGNSEDIAEQWIHIYQKQSQKNYD